MRIGPWWIDAFTGRVVGGTVIALVWLRWRASRRDDPETARLGWWLLAVAAGALLLGRAGYVWINSDYFQHYPRDILDVREIGGIEGVSALIGGLWVTALWAGVTRQPLWPRLGFLTPAALWIGASAWWACRHAGCAWGRQVTSVEHALSWLVVDAPDLYQIIEPRYPVRILGAGWAVAMAGLGWALGKDGAWALGLYLIGATGLTLLRGDAVPMIGDVRVDTVVQGILAAGLLLWGLYRIGKQPQRQSARPVSSAFRKV